MATCKRPNCGHTLVTHNVTFNGPRQYVLFACPKCRATRLQIDGVEASPEQLAAYVPAPIASVSSRKKRKLENVLRKQGIKTGGDHAW